MIQRYEVVDWWLQFISSKLNLWVHMGVFYSSNMLKGAFHPKYDLLSGASITILIVGAIMVYISTGTCLKNEEKHAAHSETVRGYETTINMLYATS